MQHNYNNYKNADYLSTKFKTALTLPNKNVQNNIIDYKKNEILNILNITKQPKFKTNGGTSKKLNYSHHLDNDKHSNKKGIGNIGVGLEGNF